MSGILLPLVLTATIAGGSVSQEVQVCDQGVCETYQRAAYNFKLSANIAESDLRKCLVRETECNQKLDDCGDSPPIISDTAMNLIAGAVIITGVVLGGVIVYSEIHD